MTRENSRNNGRKGPQLPIALQETLGVNLGKRKRQTHVTDRKARRQEDRRQNGTHRRRRTSDDENDVNSSKAYVKAKQARTKVREQGSNGDAIAEELSSRNKQKPPVDSQGRTKIVMRTRSPSLEPDLAMDSLEEIDEITSYHSDSDDSIQFPRDLSPEIVLDAASRTFQDRQAEEDSEIAALERKLRGKGKTMKAFDDGFDDMLDEFEGPVAVRSKPNRGRSGTKTGSVNTLERNGATRTGGTDNDTDDPNDVSDSYNEDSDSHELSELNNEDSAQSDFEDFDDRNTPDTDVSDDGAKTKNQPVRVKENPYVAPVTSGTGTKYVPPALRKQQLDSQVDLSTLRKQVQGHLNKLSEANIISIVDEIDNLYQNNPRQDVTTVLLDALLASFSVVSALQNTFIILHAAFIAALYKIEGSDFGAEALVKVAEAFQKYHCDEATGKSTLNLISLLANLYTFGLASSTLIYDHIRVLLADFSEGSAELLLRVMRDCGPQLRSDDGTSLKQIVQEMNNVSGMKLAGGETINIRTRVMMDTITDLKNGKMKNNTAQAGLAGEHLIRMKKALGGLNSRQLRSTEPLGITLTDITNSDKQGKWWLIGASWKGKDLNPETTTTSNNQIEASLELVDDNPDFAMLATVYNMNTTLRKQIFVSIMSAADARDAFARISKLRLNRKQEPEVARVLVRCCRAENTYNPYYTILARQCIKQDHKHKMAFEIALWKFIDEITNVDSGADNVVVSDVEIENVARMYAGLIMAGKIDLSVLKTIDFTFSDAPPIALVDTLIVHIFRRADVTMERIMELFSTIPGRMVDALRVHLKEVVLKLPTRGDLTDKKVIKANCKIAISALEATKQRSDFVEDED